MGILYLAVARFAPAGIGHVHVAAAAGRAGHAQAHRAPVSKFAPRGEQTAGSKLAQGNSVRGLILLPATVREDQSDRASPTKPIRPTMVQWNKVDVRR